MKNKKFILGFLIMICLLNYGCRKNTEGLAIYLLENKTNAANNKGKLEKINLPKEPLINQTNIKEYVWNKHIIILKKGALQKLKELKKEKYSFLGVPFVLTINRKPIYLGYFWSLTISEICKFPFIPLEGIENNHISILFEADYHNFNDPRENLQIYRCLKKANLLSKDN